jgi:hypothetical protein
VNAPVTCFSQAQQRDDAHNCHKANRLITRAV